MALTSEFLNSREFYSLGTRQESFRFAEFFSGIGLIRLGLERVGMQCVFANDLDAAKNQIYVANFGAQELFPGNINSVSASRLPHLELATASFPCQDVSLAGNRNGLSGERSGIFYEFIRILRELKEDNRQPRAVLIENVVGLLTSHEGRDIQTILEKLNGLGYACDILIVDAVHFVPQSRPRVFIIGIKTKDYVKTEDLFAIDAFKNAFRPPKIQKIIYKNAKLRWKFLDLLTFPNQRRTVIDEILEFDKNLKWFDALTLERELGYIRNRSLDRLKKSIERAKKLKKTVYLTAYRRMRKGLVCLETRDDGIAGCLRTPSGGSSRQILIEVDQNSSIRMRYLTAREYGRLQGVEDDFWIPENERVGMHAFGDAVAVPAISWLGQIIHAELLKHKSD